MTEPSRLNTSSSTAAAAGAASNNTRQGYCHVCDRHVSLNCNNDEIKCSACNGGFVELFEDLPPPPPLPPQYPQQQQQTNIAGSANFNSFPSFLSSILQQHQQVHQRATRPNQTNTTTATQQQQQPNFIFRTLQMPHGATTQRIEVIVPGGEQLDFYGMLNNLIGGLLGPNATQRPGSHGPMHFVQVHGNSAINVGDYAWGPSGLDAIITQLLNQLETSGPAPATEAQIAALASEIITNDHLEKGDQCAICMDEYKLIDKTKKLPCKHYFHESCIAEWLKLHGTCPVCRKTLNGEDTSQREYVRPAGSGATASGGGVGTTGDQQVTTPSSTNDESARNPSSSSSSSNSNINNPPNNNFYDEMDFD